MHLFEILHDYFYFAVNNSKGQISKFINWLDWLQSFFFKSYKMLFELSEVQKQESLVDNLQESRKNIQDRLIRSYSANQKHKSSLQDKFSSMIK
jgi:hypothetical protein